MAIMAITLAKWGLLAIHAGLAASSGFHFIDLQIRLFICGSEHEVMQKDFTHELM